MLTSLLYLLLAAILLEFGNGLLGVLVPIQGELAGFSIITIGGFGTLYYLGFVVGCMFLPRLIRGFGHIRSFSALPQSPRAQHSFTPSPSRRGLGSF